MFSRGILIFLKGCDILDSFFYIPYEIFIGGVGE